MMLGFCTVQVMIARVGAAGDGEFAVACGPVEELPGVSGDRATEAADPVGEAAGCRPRLAGNLWQTVRRIAGELPGLAAGPGGRCAGA
jgi:hypothetical protein